MQEKGVYMGNGNNELEQLEKNGYCADMLSWDGRRMKWGTFVVPMTANGTDNCPPGVSKIDLLEPDNKEDRWLDGALISVPRGSSTPVQHFDPRVKRTFIEEPTEGSGIWLGVNPDRESVLYIPGTVCSLATRKQEGSVVYGEDWVQCWVNIGRSLLQYAEVCMDRFDSYENKDVIRELKVNEDVGAPMFWGLLSLLRETSR